MPDLLLESGIGKAIRFGLFFLFFVRINSEGIGVAGRDPCQTGRSGDRVGPAECLGDDHRGADW